MAVPWEDFFVEPSNIGGFDIGAAPDLAEWPFTTTDAAVFQGSSGESGTLTFNFDLSLAPGDKKGFVFWVGVHSQSATGYSIDEIRVYDGTTLLDTDATPELGPLASTSITNTSMRIYYFQIPDSYWSTDPEINDINIEIDITNLLAGNNSLTVSGVRLSKSPFTAAEEADPPATLSGNRFVCYRASDLYALGGEDDEEIIVWPDASGRGMHLLRVETTGTPANLHDNDGPYVDFPEGANGTAFIGAFGLPAVTGDHIHHARVMFYEGSVGGSESRTIYSQPRTTFMTVTGAPGDKNILALNQDTGADRWVLMSGDGSGGAHIHGGTITLDTWYRPTQWVQDSGNEHLWLGDDASPTIDAASGSNDLVAFGVGAREDFNSARYFEGRISELWFIDGAGFTEGNIDDGRDVWVAQDVVTFEQEGFRWRNDDGDEDAATWMALQDVDINTEVDTTVRLRIITNATGAADPSTGALTLQYKRSDEPSSEWRTI